MRHLVWLTAAFAVLFTAQALAENAGFITAQIPASPGPSLEVGIWYPTAAHPSQQRLELFTQTVAPGAEPLPGRRPLIVLSHGSGASYSSHYDTALALAQAGFVVAAASHTGDTYKDHSRETNLPDRPRHIHAVLDYMLTTWPGHTVINSGAVGAFGFSIGGFTMLVAIGGVPDMDRTIPFCNQHPQDFGCQLRKAHPETTLNTFPADVWLADPRIRAAVIAAPAVGYAFTRDGLAPSKFPSNCGAPRRTTSSGPQTSPKPSVMPFLGRLNTTSSPVPITSTSSPRAPPRSTPSPQPSANPVPASTAPPSTTNLTLTSSASSSRPYLTPPKPSSSSH